MKAKPQKAVSFGHMEREPTLEATSRTHKKKPRGLISNYVDDDSEDEIDYSSEMRGLSAAAAACGSSG